MAANDQILILKFKDLFQSNDFLKTSQAILLADEFLGPVHKSDTPAEKIALVNERFNLALNDANFTDATFIGTVMGFSNEALKAMGPELVADVMKNKAYQAVPVADRQRYEIQVNDIYNFSDIQKAIDDSNLTRMALNEGAYRSMIENSTFSDQTKQRVKDDINKAMADFDALYAHVDNAKLAAGPKYYGNPFKARDNVMGKLRASYSMLLGPVDGKNISDLQEDFINYQKDEATKNAALLGAAASHDETVMAIIRRRNLNEADYQNAFLADKIGGSNKENPHFLVSALKTFGMSAGVTAAVGILKNIPVVGNYIGGALGIATIVKKAHSEYRKAKLVAKSQNRNLDRRDIGKIALNTAASAIPYVAMVALGPVGRYVGAAGMTIKSYMTDIAAKKEKLKDQAKLSAKDYLKSLGKSAVQGAAVLLGGKLGSTVGQTIGSHLFAANTVEVAVTDEVDNQQDLNLTTENVETAEAAENTTEEIINQTTGPKRYVIDASEEELSKLHQHKFDLTDYTRGTANPANNRMYQYDAEAGEYTRQPWYTAEQYQTAIDTLHHAGVADADGALRNLAGASRWFGNEYTEELNKLLNGNFSNTAADHILKADELLDPIGGLEHTATNVVTLSTPAYEIPNVSATTNLTEPTVADMVTGLPPEVSDYGLTEAGVTTPAEFTPEIAQAPAEYEAVVIPEVDDTVEDPTQMPPETPDYQIDDQLVAQQITAATNEAENTAPAEYEVLPTPEVVDEAPVELPVTPLPDSDYQLGMKEYLPPIENVEQTSTAEEFNWDENYGRTDFEYDETFAAELDSIANFADTAANQEYNFDTTEETTSKLNIPPLGTVTMPKIDLKVNQDVLPTASTLDIPTEFETVEAAQQFLLENDFHYVDTHEIGDTQHWENADGEDLTLDTGKYSKKVQIFNKLPVGLKYAADNDFDNYYQGATDDLNK